MESTNLLEVSNLCVDFETDQGLVHAVRDVSFSLKPGEILGIVGESGSGKSVTMYAIMGLLAANGILREGRITFDGDDISRSAFPTEKAYIQHMNQIRGNKMAMIFQDPMTFLNPLQTIERQIMEPILNHTSMSREEARTRALELMVQVGIPSPEKRIRQYPHQFSGGMRQRIIIAIALANNPKLLIADEPTTALDVTIQAQILELIRDLTRRSGTSTVMITHDLGVVACLCDRILIMYGGKVMEAGTDREIFYSPNHPYTRGLLSCINNPEAEEEQDLIPIPGSPPDLLKPPRGCPFVDRCEQAMKICKVRMPDSTVLSDTHISTCWLNEVRRRAESDEAGKGGDRA